MLVRSRTRSMEKDALVRLFNNKEIEDGSHMLAFNPYLFSLVYDLPNLKNGENMFFNCQKLQTAKCRLDSLEDGKGMFGFCKNLREAEFGGMNGLLNGSSMFGGCENLLTFCGEMSSLLNGAYMFQSCSSLQSFSGDLSTLKNGCNMFYYCEKLKSFRGNLTNLNTAFYMFFGCELDTESLTNIANTISLRNGHTIHIGLGRMPSKADKWQLRRISEKGWKVIVDNKTKIIQWQ